MDMKEGMRVRYIGCDEEQVKFGSTMDPRPFLITNAEYIIEKVEPHKWHTKLWLKGLGGPFNSVCFEEVEDAG
jgi:hypothetical protein